jgi:hypothetical protein
MSENGAFRWNTIVVASGVSIAVRPIRFLARSLYGPG